MYNRNPKIDALGWVIIIVVGAIILYGLNSLLMKLLGQDLIAFIVALFVIGLTVAIPALALFLLVEGKLNFMQRLRLVEWISAIILISYIYLLIGNFTMVRLERPIREAFVKEAMKNGDVYGVVRDRNAFALSRGFIPVAYWWVSYQGKEPAVSLVDVYISIRPIKIRPNSEHIKSLEKRYAMR